MPNNRPLRGRLGVNDRLFDCSKQIAHFPAKGRDDGDRAQRDEPRQEGVLDQVLPGVIPECERNLVGN